VLRFTGKRHSTASPTRKIGPVGALPPANSAPPSPGCGSTAILPSSAVPGPPLPPGRQARRGGVPGDAAAAAAAAAAASVGASRRRL
jgi:hypothetical protein